MPKYSFIIPVYNVEKYLKKCVDSVLSQTFNDYEIILVDDGSTDTSRSICDAYAKSNSQIIVVHQSNAGLSAARNNGVNLAQGSFLIFLDSDDYWYSKSSLEHINETIKDETDILFFSSWDYGEESKEYTKDRYDYPDILNNFTSQKALAYMIKNDLFNVSAAKKVFKKSFFIDNNLFFKRGIKSEDIEQFFRVANCNPKYRFLDERVYVYRHRSGSISSTINEKHLYDYYYIIKKYSCFNYSSKKTRELLLSYLAYQYSLLLANITNVRSKSSKELLRKLKKYDFLYNYTSYPRTRSIAKMYHIFGYNLTRIVLCLYLKWKKSKRR